MADDADDLFALALGENYCQPTVSSEKIEDTKTVKPTEGPDYASLFRQLLVGSRSQISRLTKENERLTTNLANALSSGGVVVCPHCTHHFKDRQCVLRPRTMKKMRARNCVELEFNTEEDLESWLYLNQLETNNDGLPTVLRVKPVEGAKNLKEAGSLLPELVEKKRKEEEERKLEEQRKEAKKNKRKQKKEEKKLKQSEKEAAERREEPTKGIELNKLREKEAPVKARIEIPIKRKREGPEEDSGKDRKTPRKEPPNIEENQKKSIRDRIAFIPRTVSPPKVAPKPKRAPIVWDSPPAAARPISPVKPQVAAAPIEFKIPERKKHPLKIAPSSNEKLADPRAQLNFVSTAAKKEEVVHKIQSTSSSFSSNVIKTVENVQKTEKIVVEPMEIDASSSWRVFSLKRIAHDEPHSRRWNQMNHMQKFEIRRQNEGRREVQKMVVTDGRKPPMPALTLENLGVSKECMEILKRRLNAAKAEPTPCETAPSTSSEAAVITASIETTVVPSESLAKPSPKPPNPPPSKPSETITVAVQAKVPSELSASTSTMTASSSFPDTDDDEDVLREFFPSIKANFERIEIPGLIAIPVAQPPNFQNQETESDESFEKSSITSVTDQEEDELLRLVRADTASLPNYDEMPEQDDTIVQRIEQDEDDDGGDGFCLEDVDFGDQMNFSFDHSQNGEEDQMENPEENDLFDMENMVDSREYEEDEEEEEVDWDEQMAVKNREEHEAPSTSRSDSKALEMRQDFRLSDEEDLISPVTSTPKPELNTSEDDHVEEEEDEEEEEDYTMRKNESFVEEELDWNYGTDYEENAENPEAETIQPSDEPQQEEEEKREDGEISEDDEAPVEEKKKTVPVRERIRFDGACLSSDDDDIEKSREKQPSRIRKSRNSRRRSSEENRVELPAKTRQNPRRGSQLKHKNS